MNNWITILREDLNSMSMKQHILCWISCSFALFLLMAFYFSGVPFLIEIVAPEANREWGALENTQLLLLLGIFGLSVYAVLKKTAFLQRCGFAFLTFASLFFFLEEMDYGGHFMHLLYGEKTSLLREATGMNNIHNEYNGGVVSRFFKRAGHAIILFFFGITPFLFWNKEKLHPIVRYLIPRPRMFILTTIYIISYVIPRLLTRWLKLVDPGPLTDNNIGEFGEMMVYATFLIYTRHIVFEKEWPLVPAPERH